MRSRLLISVSAAALIAGAGLASAQDRGGPSGGPSAPPQTTGPAQQSSPPASQPGGGAQKGGAEKGGGQMEQRQEAPPARAQQQKGDQPQRAQDQRNQREDRAQDQRNQRDDRAQERNDRNPDRNQREDRAQDKSTPKGGATTGQGAAGSGGSLTGEQRTKISTSIRQTNVTKVTNVNFNVSVGTVVPRTVALHALPPTVIEVYPEWRPYRFVLVGDDIVIIEPGSYRIIAVIPA